MTENQRSRLGWRLRHVLALLCLLFTSLNASAYVVGDKITHDSITYKVTNDETYTVSVTSLIGGVRCQSPKAFMTPTA